MGSVWIPAAALLVEEALQGPGLSGSEGGQPEEPPDAALVVRGRMLPARVVGDSDRVQAQLHGDEAQQLVAELQGSLGGEAMEQADEADLVGEPEAVVVAAAEGDLGQVGLAQGRVADQLPPGEGGGRHGRRTRPGKRASFQRIIDYAIHGLLCSAFAK